MVPSCVHSFHPSTYSFISFSQQLTLPLCAREEREGEEKRIGVDGWMDGKRKKGSKANITSLTARVFTHCLMQGGQDSE